MSRNLNPRKAYKPLILYVQAGQAIEHSTITSEGEMRAVKGDIPREQLKWPLAIVAVPVVWFIISNETVPANREAVIIDRIDWVENRGGIRNDGLDE
jgi:hypothetical protein